MLTTRVRRRGSELTLCALAATCIGTPALAVEIGAGDWKFTANGNVNVHYIYAQCEKATSPVIAGGLACQGTGGRDTASSISNGLLPAALAIGASTTQNGLDLAVTFGFYPGVSTNDASPNLQQGASNIHTALGTTAIDMRQVFLTFGNKSMGTFKLGRDIGLFGSDAILNDMTLPGVGAGNGNYATPANTSLGSIGLGYIYADWLAQIDYTTPDLAGFKITLGVYDPLQPLPEPTPAVPNSEPGVHAKISWTGLDGALYFSASGIGQKVRGVTSATDFTGKGFDVGGKVKLGGLEVLGWYYNAKGLGTTALFNLASDGLGHERDSDGFLAQATFKFGGGLKLGVNYGESKLKLASGEVASPLVSKNRKYTGGIYYSLTDNLTLLTEYSDVEATSHDGNKNKSHNYNVGAYLSF